MESEKPMGFRAEQVNSVLRDIEKHLISLGKLNTETVNMMRSIVDEMKVIKSEVLFLQSCHNRNDFQKH